MHTQLRFPSPLLIVLTAFVALTLAACDRVAAPADGPLEDTVETAEETEWIPAATPGPEARATQASLAAIPVSERCTDEQLSALGKLSEAHPEDDAIFAFASETFEGCFSYESLVAVFERRPEALRDDEERRELARIYLRHAGRFEDALAVADPLVQAYPDDFVSRGVAAASLYYLGRLEEIGPYVDPMWNYFDSEEYIEIMTMRAEAWIAQGNPERARRIYEEVLLINPNYPFVLNSYGLWLVQGGDENDEVYGERLLRRAENINAVSDRESAQGTRIADLSKAMMNAWDDKDYEKTLQLALQLQPILPEQNQVDIHRTLGKVYSELGRNDEARIAFEKAVEYETELARKQLEEQNP